MLAISTLSKIVVEDESKPHNNVRVHSDFNTVNSDNNLIVSQGELDFFSFISSVHQLSTKCKLNVPVKHQEAGHITQIARCDPMHSHAHLYRLELVIRAKEW